MLFLCISIGILFVMTALGFAVTYAHLYGWIPKEVSHQSELHLRETFQKRLPVISFNLVVMIVGSAIALPFFTHLFTFENSTIVIMVGQFFLICLIDDALFYVWHRLLHENKWLYRKIHRIHTRFKMGCHGLRYRSPEGQTHLLSLASGRTTKKQEAVCLQ